MKCPKCGYNSFEFLDSCKKCGIEFSTFKKSHRISAILFRSGSASAAAPLSAAPQSRSSLAEAAAPIENLAPAIDEEFSWEAPAAPDSPQPADNAYTGFNLDFVDLPKAGDKDTEFNGFSFDDPAPGPSETPHEVPMEGFSIDETTDHEPAAFSWEMPADAVSNEMEKYQRMLEPDSMGEAAAGQEGEAAAGEKDYFGTMDFAFEAEQTNEDIFQQGEVTGSSKPSDKGSRADLEDFDKEFEMIFSLEDKEESGDKSSN